MGLRVSYARAVRSAGLPQRWLLFTILIIAGLASAAPPASASITLGQLSETPSATTCGNQLDFAQLSVDSGNSYVVPGPGTITSWTTFGSSGPAQRTFKAFRKVAAPSRYQVVGH